MKEITKVKNMNESRANLKVMLALSLSLFLAVVLAFVSISYAWIFSTYFSDITGMNIALSDSQGLIMIINGEVTQTISINDYLGEAFSEFSLKEVSSANGEDLFLRDMSTYYNDEAGIYDSVSVARDDIGIIQFRPANFSDNNLSYIHFSFMLQAAGTNRYLIFDSVESFIKNTNGELMYPIRVSLSFDDGTTEVTKIVGNRQEYVGNYYTQAISNLDSYTKVGYTTNQNVNSFQGYNGYNGGTFSPAKTLFYLQQDVNVNVTVRIWLEGGDPLCRDEIAGSELDINLKFDNIDESEV